MWRQVKLAWDEVNERYSRHALLPFPTAKNRSIVD